ncbi:MAG: prepilin-type N-terminal cleavage/methylation domain-containing protein [Phycisphaerales bacterium]|nr:prepilin-type N-terminal cleavage/methylation domain-containing protein [Phycisphaerales bacterium]
MISRSIKRGFTLIEILIVVVILGVLAALVVPSVVSALADAQSEAADARGSQILTMITRYNQFLPGGGTAISTADGAIAAADLTKLTTAGYCTAADIENQLEADGAANWTFATGKVIPTP